MNRQLYEVDLVGRLLVLVLLEVSWGWVLEVSGCGGGRGDSGNRDESRFDFEKEKATLAFDSSLEHVTRTCAARLTTARTVSSCALSAPS